MARGGQRTYCTVEGCDRRVNGHGLCAKHYQEAWHKGIAVEGAPWRQCSVEGCEKFARSRGLCSKHYQRLRTHGDPQVTKIGEFGKGSVNAEGYRRIKIDGKSIAEHRLVMEQVLDRPLERNETVHHKNGDRLDNRPENLELWVGSHPRGASSPHCPTCTCFEH